MRVLLTSDVHANPWALRAVADDAGQVDQVLFAGDAVNYGPAPGEVLRWLREHGAIGVRGNHDHAVAHGADPQASPAKQPLALAMRDWTRDQLSAVELNWLKRLPLKLIWETGGVRFAMMHATASDPLHDYRLRPEILPSELMILIGEMDADVIVCGHTHLPFVRELGERQVVNPGSVGQPLDGDPRASYAVWEDGIITLKRVPYDVERACGMLQSLPLQSHQVQELIEILHAGRTRPS